MHGLHLTMKWKTQYLLFDWIMWFVLWLSSADVNECLLQTANCSTNAFCTDTEGSYNCTCNFGYTGNGVTCCKRTTVALARMLMKRSCSLLYLYQNTSVSSLFYTLNMFYAAYILQILYDLSSDSSHFWFTCSLYQWPSSTSQWFWAFSQPEGR